MKKAKKKNKVGMKTCKDKGFWMKVKERKKKMRCKRKDEAVERLKTQKLIRADRDELFSDSPRHTLSCSTVWVTLFPFGRQNALSRKSEKEIQ